MKTITHSGQSSNKPTEGSKGEATSRSLASLLSWPPSVQHIAPSRHSRHSRLRLERLEARLALSGFGPEDGAYIEEPWFGGYNAVQIQPADQKIVAGGFGGVARYDVLGSPDLAFGNGGVSTAMATTNVDKSLMLQADGKVVTVGSIGVDAIATARLNTDGAPDSSFDGDGISAAMDIKGQSDIAYAVGLQSTGKIVVAGASGHDAVVGRFKASGAIDSGKNGFGQIVNGRPAGYSVTSFGANYYSSFNGLAVQPDDKVVAVGSVLDATSNNRDPYRLIVARYTASGVLDTTFNGSGYSTFLPPGFGHTQGSDVELQSDGKIVVAGYSSGVDGVSDMLVARFNTNGTLDTGFGGGSGYVQLDIDGTVTPTGEYAYGLAIQPDGKIVAAGWEATAVVGSNHNVLVARFNSDGTPDVGFGTGGFKLGAAAASRRFHGQDVALQSDGSIIVAGLSNVTSGNSDPRPLLMRFFGSQPTPLLAAGGAATAPSDIQTLTMAQVQPVLTEAIARWQATGVDTSGLGSIDVRIATLDGTTLGLTSGNTIWLDDNAAGWGWFVDPTPSDDSEFLAPGDQGEQDHMDLLTTVMHELGHLLGHDHDDDGVMAEALAAGTRGITMEGETAAVDREFGLLADGPALAWLALWDAADGIGSGPCPARRK